MRTPQNCMLLLLATRSTFGSVGEAYSAQSGSKIRQAEFSTILFFVVFALLTLLIRFWMARRATSSSEYLTAGSSISSGQNGLAIAGDYMSAGAFLGLSGAIYASGLDGMFLAASYLASRPIVLFLVAEPLRRLGKYSFADVLAHKLIERPVRILAGASTLVIGSFYLVAQMAGAGELISLLFGIERVYRESVGRVVDEKTKALAAALLAYPECEKRMEKSCRSELPASHSNWLPEGRSHPEPFLDGHNRRHLRKRSLPRRFASNACLRRMRRRRFVMLR